MKHGMFLATFAFISQIAVAGERRSFAIITDAESYARCGKEIEMYREAVEDDGLRAFVISSQWNSPEEIRDTLLFLHENKGLEGTVFIGEIPVPMIRGAQHLTSAFKMDEEKFPMRESSVPSDRFYDDFDLKFDFICRDSTDSGLFYYELSSESPQYISCDIYSGRIYSCGTYTDKYAELAGYLRKISGLKKEINPADRIMSYTGDGSFSNSLIAWKDESITLREQFPAAFKKNGEARFLAFAMYPSIKETILREISRDDLDIAIFHEHGMPDRQYLTGIPEAYGRSEWFDTGKYLAREAARRKVMYGSSEEEAKEYVCGKYGIGREWVDDTFSEETERNDSIRDLSTGIVCKDIQETAPDVRLSIFDACYNGDFREDDCIANRYIMSGGKAAVAIGNSVNVLQDKSSSDLMGMLAAGYRIGEWMQMVNILESHIFGDPTFRFAPSTDAPRPDLESESVEYWLGIAREAECPDYISLALHKLHGLKYPGMSDLLLKTFLESPYYMVRLQCQHLGAFYNDGNYPEMLKAGTDDPYEFIRRKSVFYIGKYGKPELADDLAAAYLQDYNSKRVAFNIGFSAGHFDNGIFTDRLNCRIDSSDFIVDKERFKADAEKMCSGPVSVMNSTRKALSDKDAGPGRKSLYLSGMRNNPYPHLAGAVLDIAGNPEEDTELRIKAAEVLGWYVRAWNKGEIIDSLKDMLDTPDLPEELEAEIRKSLSRLEHYCN